MNHLIRLFQNLLLVCSWLLFAQASFGQGSISGKITDTQGEPITGATVLVANLSVGSLSDESGSYAFEVPEGEHTVSVSFIGYATVSEVAKVTNGQNTNLDITLSEDVMGLDEVVITGGFSERTQRNAPISMTVLNAKQLRTSKLQFSSRHIANYPRRNRRRWRR